MFEKQKQEAGDNVQQIQANTVILHNGITEERARAIVDERLSDVLKAYSSEAHSVATERVEKFADDLIPKLVKLNLLESLKNPSIQILLSEAQKTAASTEREVDYGLLSELLIHRVKKGADRKIRAGINQAVEIVDEISDDALLGLTVYYCATKFTPITGMIKDGLSVLNALFEKVIYNSLPNGREWVDHLDVLNAVRIHSFGSIKKINQFYPENLSGYVDVGIKIDSDAHEKSKDIISQNKLPNDILVTHELRSDYLRIPVLEQSLIEELKVINLPINIPFSETQKQSVKEIYTLYENNQNLRQENIKVLMEMWNDYPFLKKLKDWWDSISPSFMITPVGSVLAHANAQRCDPNVPTLD